MSDSVEKNRAETSKKGVVPVPRAMIPHLDECALLFDIDGTLIDLAATPDSIIVPPNLRDNLDTLFQRTAGALALVSGRSLADIDGVFAPLRLPAIGGHGAEARFFRDGIVQQASVPSLAPKLKQRISALTALSPGILLEDKGYSMALHYRLAPQAERPIHEAIKAIRAELPEAPIEVLGGKFVVEVKQQGFSKATAVRELMKLPPFKGRRPVFLGDDITDETVFAIMPDLDGIAFSVGRKARGVAGHFDSPEDVRRWLALLLDGVSVATK